MRGATIIMDRRSSNIVLGFVGFFLFITMVVEASQNNTYSHSEHCSGPIKFYEELSCTPIHENGGSGCPVRYNCDHWKNLSDDECLINGNKYKIGEQLKQEDGNRCELGCRCSDAGDWLCAMPSCRGLETIYTDSGPLDCYLKTKPTDCCPGPTICLERGEKRPTCVVDGKTYKAGERFVPLAEPEKLCYCDEGYTGENVEPFCTSPKHTWCNNVLHHASSIRRGCIAVYKNDELPHKSCARTLRCPHENDAVIKGTPPSTFTTSELENPDLMCKFGNLTMQIGDELNQDVDWTSICVKCVCEVPPMPTCQVRPRTECIPSEHGDYD